MLKLRCVLIFALFAEWGLAISVNRTIDDTYGDSVTGWLPHFMPNSWVKGAPCSDCHNGTVSEIIYYDGSDDGRNITMQFTGTSVYVYHILIQSLTNLSFTLDEASAGSYLWVPTASAHDPQYNVPVYVNEGLENREHTLVTHLVGPASIGRFDYVVYTFDDGVSPSSEPMSILQAPTVTPTPTATPTAPAASPPTATVPSSYRHRSLPIGAVIGGSDSNCHGEYIGPPLAQSLSNGCIRMRLVPKHEVLVDDCGLPS
ncbi:hypothetical protein C8Q74DRAFT_246112 [Fomes fomentarius]|nr:hypothetical protein C8Q74DRAFT_246112 [Fomes fomentarius]